MNLSHSIKNIQKVFENKKCNHNRDCGKTKVNDQPYSHS